MDIDTTELARPLQVYLVEDSQILRRLLIGGIEAVGAELSGCSGDARTAIADLSTLQPDVIMIDIALASGNGFDVLKALQDQRLAASAVKVVLTNYATPEYKERSVTLGADRFFDKSSETWQALTLISTLAAKAKTGSQCAVNDSADKITERPQRRGPHRAVYLRRRKKGA